MSTNTTENQTVGTSTGDANKDDTFTLMVILIVTGTVLLLTVGGVVIYLVQRRRNTNEDEIGSGSIFGHYGSHEETTNYTRNSRESGAYRSYDAINEDMLGEIHVEMGLDLQEEPVHAERRSRSKTTSGAYIPEPGNAERRSKTSTISGEYRSEPVNSERRSRTSSTSGAYRSEPVNSERRSRTSSTSGAYRSEPVNSERRSRTSSTSGAYRSEPVNSERRSRTSTTSGAYRSFDDLSFSDFNTRDYIYEREIFPDRSSYNDSQQADRKISVISNDENVSQSMHRPGDERKETEFRRYGSEEKLNDTEMFEDLANRAIDNPMFSDIRYYDN